MATKLITVSRAKAEAKRLLHYIDLAESYEADTLDKLIIKEYAFTNSIAEIVRRFNAKGYKVNGQDLDHQYVANVIKSKASSELHRVLKSGYMKKINHSRNH
ncbi:hypothetical protein ACFSO7_20755 [Bacillus sp. CGMCC 1.16607]|uniref:hypothetical protein n=1 Tax=Bacillus sp. CGMCC 1.16607 TaxID=3351842 RepID=UPI00363F32B3